MTETTARERPILFSGDMILALLYGRKTQTRRIVKPQPEFGINPCHYSKTGWAETDESLKGCQCGKAVKCPYGIPGDRLWVREGFGIDVDNWAVPCVVYRADSMCLTVMATEGGEGDPCGVFGVTTRSDWDHDPKWRPSIHMPRWASRITLEITDVRVQRLQDISEEDAIAEGCQCAGVPASLTNRGAFAKLWNSINGDGSWESNPWVWAVSFHKLENKQ